MITVFALLGAKALWLTYLWLGSAIICGWLATRKGYSEKTGLATGLIISAAGILVWLVWPARPDSRWKVHGPFGRGGGKTVAEVRAESDTAPSQAGSDSTP